MGKPTQLPGMSDAIDKAGGLLNDALEASDTETVVRALLLADKLNGLAYSMGNMDLALIYSCATQALALHLRERERTGA